MTRCSRCGQIIPAGTRFYLGKQGGKYHVACARLAFSKIRYTPSKRRT